jgi:hypothetical protein
MAEVRTSRVTPGTRGEAGAACDDTSSPVRLILSRDEHTTGGYNLALVTTDRTAAPGALVTRYAARWAIEQAFADAGTRPAQPTSEQIHAVLAAWDAAAA